MLAQTPEMQSVASLHPWFVPQRTVQPVPGGSWGAGGVPPQSMPVSPWFFLPSWQLGASQMFGFLQVEAVQQLSLEQSSSTLHVAPAAQVFAGLTWAQTPPQSGPVSVPF